MALDLGGAETHVVSLAAALKQRGHDVLVASAGGAMVSSLRAAQVEHETAPLNSRHPVRLARGARILRRLIASFHPELLHAHARIPAFLCDLVRGQLPLVTTYHGIYASGFPWSVVTRVGDATIAVSEDVRRYLCQRFRADPRRVLVIPNGIDLGTFRPGLDPAPLREDAGLRERDRVILHAGRFERDVVAATLTILAAAPSLLQDPDTFLFLLGDGPERERVLEAAARVNGLLGRQAVRWVGRQQNMPPWYNLATVVLGSGRVALEAMACGVPVVVVGGGGSETAGGWAGVTGLAEPATFGALMASNFCARGSGQDDPDAPAAALTGAVRRALADPELAVTLGRAGRHLVEERYSLAAMTTRVEEVYQWVLEHPPRGGR